MPPTFETADALLVADVGNTRIGLGVWDDDGLRAVQRLAGDEPAAWPDALRSAWGEIAGRGRRALVIGSVHPQRARAFADLAGQVCEHTALFVRDDLPLPMPLAIDSPQEVGVDRICSAAAAYERVQGPCAVASFGTATTIDCVSEDGRFLGGSILPGIDMQCVALSEFTAGLPRIVPSPPHDAFGRNTYEAINHGVLYGAVGALREIVERYASQLGLWPQLVVTGGSAPLVLPLIDFVDAHVPDLCLMGVALTYRRAST